VSARDPAVNVRISRATDQLNQVHTLVAPEVCASPIVARRRASSAPLWPGSR
jgi:hypothetical protein